MKKFDPIKDLNEFKDVLKFHGISEEHWDSKNIGLSTDEIGYKEEKAIVAAYNGFKLSDNKLPDWRDGTIKRYPIFIMPDSSGAGFSFHVNGCWLSTSYVGSRQVFTGPNSYENLYDAVVKFLSQYERSRTK